MNILKKDGNFCGELEISAISEIFNISIYVIEFDNNNSGYRILYKINNENILIQHTMILNHCYLENSNIEHFDMLKINQMFDNNKLNNIEDSKVNNKINIEKKRFNFINDHNISMKQKDKDNNIEIKDNKNKFSKSNKEEHKNKLLSKSNFNEFSSLINYNIKNFDNINIKNEIKNANNKINENIVIN